MMKSNFSRYISQAVIIGWYYWEKFLINWGTLLDLWTLSHFNVSPLVIEATITMVPLKTRSKMKVKTTIKGKNRGAVSASAMVDGRFKSDDLFLQKGTWATNRASNWWRFPISSVGVLKRDWNLTVETGFW